VVKKVIQLFTSLRLTVACLAIGILIVFFGTLAQVNEGLYNAQARWFRSVFVWWSPAGANWRIPMFPGGYLVGTILLVNLLAAHAARFRFAWKKAGIHILHAGIILLLVGQLATDMLSEETQMNFAEGESRNFSVSPQSAELAFITDCGNPEQDKVVAIPDRLLRSEKEIKHPELPVTIRPRRWSVNSDVRQRAPMVDTSPPPATAGYGRNVTLVERPEAKKMDERNVPAVLFELVGPQGSLGTFLGHPKLGDQQITIGDSAQGGTRTWRMAFRFAREYHPFSVELVKMTHDVYSGTDIPKDFRSRVRIDNPQTRESREVDIYMNNPLRYEGLTFYQYQMGADEFQRNRETSTLQIVRNPGWITPYVGCGLVAVGLLAQFLMHLIGFIKKRRKI
jgi:hypothetical protein